MYSAISECNQDIVPIYRLGSSHLDVTNNGEVGEAPHIKKIYFDDPNICGYNREGQLLDISTFGILPTYLSKIMLAESNNNLAEDHEPFEESENDMENFDPALFCPDIIMELGDTPIIINTDEGTADGSTNGESILSSVPIKEEITSDGFSDLTPEENELRKKTYGFNHPVQFARIHCTTCNDHIGSALSDINNMMVHPLLKVLICKECYDFYTSGEFEKDQDGSETYCRWCGQGGLVICCSNCEFVFCTRCIRNNFGRKILTRIRDSDEWICYKCDPSQLSNLRVLCAEFMEYLQRETARFGHDAPFMDRDYSTCCSTTNTKVHEPKKLKRTYSDDDQDYDPDAEQLSRRSSSSSIKSVSSDCDEANTATVGNRPTIAPNPVNSTKTIGIVNRAKVTFVSHPKPHMVNPTVRASDVRSLPVDSSQIKMLPNEKKVAIVPPRNSIPSSAGPRQTPIRKTVPQPVRYDEQQRKRMCYETAVRAASRINSDLSCNLIKLRKEKTNARKLDDVVQVHNKLQEALHGSINSLIQLRKTLAVADMNSKCNAPKPAQQPAPKRRFFPFDPAIVSNFFKATPSQAFKDFNKGFAANLEKAKLIGIKDATNSGDTTGSASQTRPGASLLIISNPKTNAKGQNIDKANP